MVLGGGAVSDERGTPNPQPQTPKCQIDEFKELNQKQTFSFASQFLFLSTPNTGPRRLLRLDLSRTEVYSPYIRSNRGEYL